MLTAGLTKKEEEVLSPPSAPAQPKHIVKKKEEEASQQSNTPFSHPVERDYGNDVLIGCPSRTAAPFKRQKKKSLSPPLLLPLPNPHHKASLKAKGLVRPLPVPAKRRVFFECHR